MIKMKDFPLYLLLERQEYGDIFFFTPAITHMLITRQQELIASDLWVAFSLTWLARVVWIISDGVHLCVFMWHKHTKNLLEICCAVASMQNNQ